MVRVQGNQRVAAGCTVGFWLSVAGALVSIAALVDNRYWLNPLLFVGAATICSLFRRLAKGKVNDAYQVHIQLLAGVAFVVLGVAFWSLSG